MASQAASNSHCFPTVSFIHAPASPARCGIIDTLDCTALIPATMHVAQERGRELCKNLGICFSATFTTMFPHSFSDPAHLHTLKTPHRKPWPRLTAVQEACRALLALQADSRRTKEMPRNRKVRYPRAIHSPRHLRAHCTTWLTH